MPQPVRYAPEAFDDLLPPGARLGVSRARRPSRLTLCLPHCSSRHVYGGMASALELGRHLARHYEAVRVLSLAPWPSKDECLDVAALFPGKGGAGIETVSLHDAEEIVFHQRDVLLCPYWRTVLIWERVAELLTAAGLAPNKFYYLIQDWEPGFYPMSLKHMAAEATYGHGQNCVAILNSRELARFFHKKSYRFHNPVVVRPSLGGFFLSLLNSLGHTLPPKRTDQINVFVYGRPQHHRNCFPSLLAGIAAYATRFAPEADLPVHFSSAGMAHEDVAFDNGVVLKSLGMLSLPDYASALMQSHVGLAFMASPHPSYPPLEMASLGLQVLTNPYLGKDLSRTHPHIRSVDITRPVAVAEALGQAMATAREQAGRPRPAILPDALSPHDWQTNLRQARIPVIAVPAHTPAAP